MRRAIALAILVVLGAAAAVFAQEAKEGERKAPSVPSDRLPTLGTVGDLPKEKERLVVEVDAMGKVTIEGKPLDLEAFRKVLLDRADANREKEGPKASNLHVVLRADRDLPWQGAQWLMQECASPKVRVHRILFAALPEDGGEEGAMATFLPVVVLTPGVAVPNAPPTEVTVKLEYDETEVPVMPADLYPFLKSKDRRLDGKTVNFEIDGNPTVPTGDVLRAMDAALRFGTKSVVFKGTRPLKDPSIEEALAALPARKAGLVLTVLGTRVLPPKKDAPAMPAVERVKGNLAGVLKPATECEIVETTPIDEEPK